MAKKTTVDPKADDLDVRKQPWVQNQGKKKAPTKNGAGTTPAPVVAAPPKSKYAGVKPASMTDEEYEATLAKFNPPPAKAEKAPAKEKAPKAERPADTFRVKDWAAGEKVDPRKARGVARAHEDVLKPMWVDGLKHTFKLSDKAKVEKILHDGLAAEGKVSTPKKTKAPKIPPGAVFTGKAKTNKPPEPPPVVSAKETARKEAVKAVKGRKRMIKKIPAK
jgi:hypothetical protein